MYLAILLIIVAALVFYNEFNSKMNIAEIGLLVIALIAIIRASLNYIQMDDTINEGFGNNKHKKRHNKNKMTDTFANTKNSTSNKSHQAKQSSKFDNITEHFNTTNKDAVSQVNSLLGISSFENIPNTTQAYSQFATPPANGDDSISSVFKPQIIIGKGANDTLGTNAYGLNGTNATTGNTDNTDLGMGEDMPFSTFSAPWNAPFANDGMTFKNTMAPVANLWGNGNSTKPTVAKSSNDNDWSQSMSEYNTGKWDPQLHKTPSDYTDYQPPSAFGMSTPSTQTTKAQSKSNFDNTHTLTPTPTTAPTPTTPKKLCGAYDDLSTYNGDNLVVRNYKESKKWYPGYTYIPPVFWDVPQKRAGVCQPSGPNYHKLTGLIDRGLPINALELNPNGRQADTENTVSMGKVGSILPAFNYKEQPFSSPYV